MAIRTRTRAPRRATRSVTSIARAAARKELRKQAQWVSVFDTGCSGPAFLDPAEVCPNGGVLQLVSPEQLQSHDDEMRILRIRANLRIGWNIPNNGRDCFQQQGFIQTSLIQARMGLKRAEYEGDPATASGLAFNPLDSRPDTRYPNEFDGDFADARWMRLWDYSWFPTPTITSSAAPPTCCAVTVQDSYVVPPTVTGSNPGYIVPGLNTQCITCDVSDEPIICGTSITYPSAFSTWSFDWKKAIQLKDNQTLGLFMGWSLLSNGVNFVPADQPQLIIVGDIKMLVETA